MTTTIREDPGTARELGQLRERVHGIANKVQETMGKETTRQGPSTTAMVAMIGSGIGILLGVIGMGTLVFNIGSSVTAQTAALAQVRSDLARAEASIVAGKDQREKDVARIEMRLREQDAELRAVGNRLTRLETLQRMQPLPVIPSTPQAGPMEERFMGQLPLVSLALLRREFLGD